MVMVTWVAAAAFALSAQAAPGSGALIEVGHADWDSFPTLQKTDRLLPTSFMINKVETILRMGECRFEGQTYRRFDITVPYAVQMRSDGALDRIVVADIGCPMLETYVGNIVLELASMGDFNGNNPSSAQWYASKINFTLE